MNLDVSALRGDLAALAGELRALRMILGARWERPMADEQRRQRRLRRRATDLHVLLAFARGKEHTRDDAPYRAYLLHEEAAS